jgi:uncharacterized RDD family membrane protein YckC
VLDTSRRIATPEGIELTLRLAGPVPRALAWAIDLLLRAVVLAIIALSAAALRQFGAGIILLSAFLIEWLYPAWFEATWGSTPGKRAFGLIVLNDDGTPLRWSAALTRNLLRAVDFLPAMYFTGFVTMVMNRDFKRLGDFAANTLVVYREEKLEIRAIPEAEPQAPGFALSIAEQRAIIDFAARSTGLTPERAEELAQIPRSLIDGAPRGAAAARLVGIANHLLGRQ